MNIDEFFSEARRLNVRMLGTPEETRAALDAKDAEIARLTADAKMERESRAMFVARIERMQLDGQRWLTLVAVLMLLNDCDMLASLTTTKEQP